jgi:hypothetical protein
MNLSDLKVSIGDNAIEFEGSFTLSEVLPLVNQWFAALPGGTDQARMDALVTQLRSQNDGLALAVSNAHPGTTAAEPPQE